MLRTQMLSGVNRKMLVTMRQNMSQKSHKLSVTPTKVLVLGPLTKTLGLAAVSVFTNLQHSSIRVFQGH